MDDRHGRTPALQIVPHANLPSTYSLPGSWVVSFDARVDRGSRLEVRLGGRSPMVLGRSRHVEATGQGSTLRFRLTSGRAQIGALIISQAPDRGALLLHRIAELHARLRPRQFPAGADLRDHLHIASRYWTSGFWPGALWQAAAWVRGPGRAMFARWALAATVAHFGRERDPTHDLGFEYGQSSLAGWEALCGGSRGGSAGDGKANFGGSFHPLGTKSPRFTCARLKRSALTAAGELLALAASNRQAGTIPTNARGAQADTIIDSAMNVAILPWASGVTGNPRYARVASRHLHIVARLLVRRDGSTAQSVHFERASGRVLFIHTHQGLSSSSTWSRGQGWAVYGFGQAAAQLHDRGLLRVALRTAEYVRRHLPGGGIPRWDYDAPAGAPVDVSAGVITAAGLMRLAASCRALPGVCTQPGSWMALGRRLLEAALRRASGHPPLGFLSSQVLNERSRGCWCNGGELIFGLDYALEALRLERGPAAR